MLSTKLLDSVGTSVQHDWQPSEKAQSAALDGEHNDGLRLASDYAGCFTLPASPSAVSQYLDSHHEWFGRCAYPMTVSRLGPNSYSLCPGRFKCLNFAVEPIIGIELMPLADGVYQLQNISLNHPIDGPMYTLDFCLSLRLSDAHQMASLAQTDIDWELTLDIWAELPLVIRTMPRAIVRRAAMQLLNRVVNQVTQQLTDRIKTDFTNRLQSSMS